MITPDYVFFRVQCVARWVGNKGNKEGDKVITITTISVRLRLSGRKSASHTMKGLARCCSDFKSLGNKNGL